MSESVRRPLLPVALAAVLLLAAPAHAEPDAPAGAGRSDDTPAQSASLPAPDHAAAHEAVADAGRPADVPQGPPAGAPQAPPARPAPDSASGVSGASAAGRTDAEPAVVRDRGRKVVVCKYVRKPGVDEVFSHLVVVSENALEGRGFAGTFPFAFSDAHFNSLAVRYAVRGEQANEISEAVCPAGTPSGDEPSEEDAPGEVAGIGEDRRHGPASGNGGTGDVLPATGAPEHLLALGLLGATALLGGAWLALRRGPVGA